MNFDNWEPPEQKKTWKPVAAGIMMLALGGYGLARGIFKMAAGLSFFPSYFGVLGIEMPGIILIITSVVCFIGATYAIRRGIWDMAFAGAVFSLFSSWPLAIVVMVLLWRSKEELI
jgi:hypothetical protein